jgi:hypothetical protein
LFSIATHILLFLYVGVNPAASRDRLLDWLEALVVGVAGHECRVYAHPGLPPTRRLRGFFQNLTNNIVDDLETNLTSHTAWVAAIGAQSAGRYIKISKRPRQADGLQMNAKGMGIFKTMDKI